jgi:5'(3')-deoxyribonucleotidase
MKINSDCDGVVADFEASLVEAIGADLRERDTWDIFSYLTEEQAKAAREILAGGEFWANLPLIDGAKEGIDFLTNMGHEIVWVTSPWTSCPDWDAIRTEWLHRHFGERPVIITKEKDDREADAFIDDKPAHIEKWQAAFPNGKAYLYDQNYNRSFSWPRRFTWDQVAKVFG